MDIIPTQNLVVGNTPEFYPKFSINCTVYTQGKILQWDGEKKVYPRSLYKVGGWDI